MKVMKVIVGCNVSPLLQCTVIGGIFGMNFERIPFITQSMGIFYFCGLMLFISTLVYIRIFPQKGVGFNYYLGFYK